MRRILTVPDLVLPLLQGVLVSAHREEVQIELGSVPVRAGHDPAVVVVVEVLYRGGRGRWTPGFWWPDEPEPRWADEDRPLRDDRVALPVHADEDGTERQVRVMVRLRPLGLSGGASATLSALARFAA